ncbi:fibronectin type III domain-containing protein [Vitiosangium sp. GDMCC 1.1324]|uniref:fibronectin type III domain-containing protein n=1 Tax=Vitiosangium sp. (strain GDMCC 1.1324) TaxID=2138576 RepID=UPI000D39161F|nr:fibronectin type III domain-containing protein [Vitiosangium sp. GDMCC 1.1324]PTL79085.1 hypothetical protein DAT35_36360 [Vitiosangium sp. GDMCC 1.1324]
MRPLSEQQQFLLKCRTGYTRRGRVRVLVGSTWHDLTKLFGRDFLEEYSVDESLDQPVAQGTVRLRREVHGISLAPLMQESLANNLTGSYAPLLDPGRLFRVEVGLAPSDREPGASDWLPLFLGRIDTVDPGPEVITVSGRDLYLGVCQDTFLEAEHVYGSDAGVALETVCQQVLFDAGLGFIGLYAPVPSTQALGKYKEPVGPVFEALSKLATARGWEVRQKWRADTGDWGVWLYGPDRTGASVAWTYGPGDYTELPSLPVSLADIRTAVEVVYSDTADLDAKGQPKRKTVRKESAAALARYGFLTPSGTRLHRFCRFTEASTSNIDTEAEAGRLAQSALDDLSQADMSAELEVCLHPGLELGDMVQLSANGVHFSAGQTLAVRQVTHSGSSGDGTTRLSLRGKPSLSPRTWLDMEARPGVAPAAPFTGPAAPHSLVVTNSVTGAVLSFTDPSGDNGVPAVEFELHVGTTPGFTLSRDTLRSVASTTCFDLTGLKAGVPLYARVRARTEKGNVGPASDVVTLTPRHVTPGDVSQNVTWAAMPLNSDFEAHTDVSLPPDAWSVGRGTWGTDITAETGTVFSGIRSVRLLGGSTPFIESQRFTVRPGDRLIASAVVLIPAPENTTHTASLQVRWHNSTGALVSEVLVSQTYSAGSDVWQTLGLRSRPVTAPAAARYASIVVSKSTPTGYSVYVDSTRVVLTPNTFLYRYPNTENGWKSAGGVKVQPRYRMNSLGEVRLSGAITGGALGAAAFYLDDGDRPGFTSDYACAGSSGPATIRIDAATGAVIPLTGASPINLDGVTFLAESVGTM